MAECAFCSFKGKLSAEHIVSQWLAKLFPGKILVRLATRGGNENTWPTNTLDWKAHVVCKKCNNTWMSELEDKHAKPALTPLVTGEINIPVTADTARSLARWAFKTAVIVDCEFCEGEPFFSRRLREAFRRSLSIPENVQMWLCGYTGHPGGGRIITFYSKGQLSPTNPLQMYVCTCAIGNLAFQVVAVKQLGRVGFAPLLGFESLAVPLWPFFPAEFVWPYPLSIGSIQQFEAFANRWRTIAV